MKNLDKLHGIPASAGRKVVFALQDTLEGKCPQLTRTDNIGVDLRRWDMTAIKKGMAVDGRAYASGYGWSANCRLWAEIKGGEVRTALISGNTCGGHTYKLKLTGAGSIYLWTDIDRSERFGPSLVANFRDIEAYLSPEPPEEDEKSGQWKMWWPRPGEMEEIDDNLIESL